MNYGLGLFCHKQWRKSRLFHDIVVVFKHRNCTFHFTCDDRHYMNSLSITFELSSNLGFVIVKCWPNFKAGRIKILNQQSYVHHHYHIQPSPHMTLGYIDSILARWGHPASWLVPRSHPLSVSHCWVLQLLWCQTWAVGTMRTWQLVVSAAELVVVLVVLVVTLLL